MNISKSFVLKLDSGLDVAVCIAEKVAGSYEVEVHYDSAATALTKEQIYAEINLALKGNE
jgi:hypothetical protein